MNTNDICTIAEGLEWMVTIDNQFISFENFTSYGKNIVIEFSLTDSKELIKEFYDYIASYDVSYNAYIWLGNDGHGKNGAPYDMKDVYDSSREELELLEKLYNQLFDYYYYQ
ncbi:hypothetical protein SAMN05421767_10424 [Granulicatella balaenopterae]|uniref:Uncharacterized protein n=1 Tax=Granulicatella balaenopterae TaxID=137733 RepID=A0A1H9I1B4_9LACT|nr:hypothetical protein [Granulicatella balaenopterae]SEQ68366.1 hypothetical protein SAMN05421767_10424 [Granulicatella balaenopterae]